MRRLLTASLVAIAMLALAAAPALAQDTNNDDNGAYPPAPEEITIIVKPIVKADKAAKVVPTRTLPTTGSDAYLALFAAAGLIGTGGAAVLVARRRNRADQLAG